MSKYLIQIVQLFMFILIISKICTADIPSTISTNIEERFLMGYTVQRKIKGEVSPNH